MKVTISGKTFTIAPSKMIGEGGEAEIYDIGGGKVAKIFKTASHISFRDSQSSQEAARKKIAEHQRKLPAFPKGMPSRIIGPSELVLDPATGKIVGFTMPFIRDCESLFSLSQRSFRESSFDDSKVVRAFIDLHGTVINAHQKKFIFGDFNDLNGLVKPDGSEVLMLDADSAQFGGYDCLLFTTKFIDPLCAKINPEGNAPVLCKRHNELSDWYAFALMVMQSWLYVGPFGGVYRPTGGRKKIPHDARSLSRITVWDADVIYPKPARPLSDLPSDVLGYFEAVFRKDKREPFPLSLLESLDRKAKGLIPEKVGPIQPGLIHQTVHGMKADRIFQTSGKILYATCQSGKLVWLYAWDGGILRENGKKVIAGEPDRKIRYRISGDRTILAKDETVIVLDADGSIDRSMTDVVSNRPMVDANSKSIFVIPNGELSRRSLSAHGPVQETHGRFIENQTIFWVGEDLGFGFYRAGNLCMYFIFKPQGVGINDSLALPPIKGQLIDATVAFGTDRIWFFVATQENAQRINRCYALDGSGNILGSAETTEGDGSWLSTIRGKSAAGKNLFVATDDGIVRVELSGSTLAVTKEFPETARFVDSGSTIIVHKGGIAVVRSGEIWNLTMS